MLCEGFTSLSSRGTWSMNWRLILNEKISQFAATRPDLTSKGIDHTIQLVVRHTIAFNLISWRKPTRSGRANRISTVSLPYFGIHSVLIRV